VRLTKTLLIATLLASIGASACGRTDLGRSPSQVVINALEAASGAESDTFGATLRSDVITKGGIYDDIGRVQFRIMLRDAGTVTQTTPTDINSVTFSRYRVEYVRSDGRNAQGVDVPYSFDSAMTLTVPATGVATGVFEIVRHTAKLEAPLKALAVNGVIISTIAQVTFYGKDLAGNDVVAAGSIGISFGNFADPEN
jgi:hypothetical protein